MTIVLRLCCCLTLGAISAGAQENTGENLASKVVDPSAGLSTITFQDREVSTRWHIDGTENEFTVQPVVPWDGWGVSQIFRVRVPFITHRDGGARGVSDVSAFNLSVFPKGWGRLVLGVITQFSPDRGNGNDQFALGPAVAAIVHRGHWTIGAFNQNLFGSSEIAISQFQPILAYTVNPTISISMGDAQYVLDWKRSQLTAVPVGVQVNYITHAARQPLRLYVNPQYNFRDAAGSAKYSTTFGVALILVK